VFLVPSNYICIAESGPILHISQSLNVVVDSWSRLQNLLAKLDSLFEFSLDKKLIASGFPCESAQPINVSLMLFNSSFVIRLRSDLFMH
jgi:hypothetical protein